MVEFLSNYLSPIELTEVMKKEPYIKELDDSIIRKFYDILEKIDFQDKEINEMILNFPRVLVSLEDAIKMISFLYQEENDNSKYLIISYPEILLEDLDAFLEFIKEKNLPIEELLDMFLEL